MDRRPREDKRTRIIAAARSEFAARGYHGTSIDAIIARAEVARATFYQCFKGKRDVFEAALEELIALVYQSLPPIIPTDEVGPQALRNIERVLEALLEDGDLARILLMEGFGPDDESREKIRRLQERLVRYAEETLQLGQTLGLVREGDVRVMAACLIGSVKEVVYQHLTGLRTRVEMASFPRELLATVMRGIGHERAFSGG
jgi:TetR/AcrR family fatty acid metabolism transcriptional regulator